MRCRMKAIGDTTFGMRDRSAVGSNHKEHEEHEVSQRSYLFRLLRDRGEI